MDALSLSELNLLVREVVESTFTSAYWITAEISSLRVAQAGHCYLELVEKQQGRNTPIANARANIWANIYPFVKMTFEEQTGQVFREGLKVLLQVNVSFNEKYGYSLTVKDIDPSYTMGDLERKRREILEQIEAAGVIDDNKNKELNRPLQRIAVISSPTAAGYEDFCNQLDNNAQGYRFCHKLFPATMQGESTAKSVIKALDKISEEEENWDVVVIIRGGGAVSDLAGFEDFELAYNCASFPLPIITGIGHERDTTVIDFVVHTHLKTPTAVASFLIDKMDEEALLINEIENAILTYADDLLNFSKDRLDNIVNRINLYANNYRSSHERQMMLSYQRFCQNILHVIDRQKMIVDNVDSRIGTSVERLITRSREKMSSVEQFMKAYDPQKILKLGYTITRLNGKVVKDVESLKEGDILESTFANGRVESIVKRKKS